MASARETRIAIESETLMEIRHALQSNTQLVEMLAGQLVNHVLEVWSGPFPSAPFDPLLAREYGVPAGSALVQNYSTTAGHNVTVTSASPVGAVAPSGIGTWIVPPGSCAVVPLASSKVTIYGTAGDLVAFQVFTSPVQPTASAAKVA